ncbi:MAG TPA: ABC transporter substrate-binding protein [Chloroflexota bacterium]|nr:ABC transporter substrate-binding protein [Chloroflexota bacterium]
MARVPRVCVALLVLALVACGPAAGGPPRAGEGAVPATAPAASPREQTPNAATTLAQPGSASYQALIDAARREGQLNLVWSNNSFGGMEGARRWAEGFNRTYGLNVDVRFTPGPAPNEVATRVVQEYQSGRPASTDVLLLGSSPLAGILQFDMLLSSDWTVWAPNVRDASFVAPGGVAVEVSMRTPGITYNTSRVRPDEVPTSLQDMLKPQYKGRVASTPYASGFDWLATSDFWGEPRTREYVSKLADQIAGLIRCGEMPRIASGEFDFLALDCGGFEALKAQRRGEPLASVIPADVAAITYWYMAVPKHAAHPAAAQLWINYLLSREAQDILWDVDAQDHYRVPGSHQAAAIAALEAGGARPVEVDVAFFQRHDVQELDRVSDDMQRLLQKQ